MKIRSLLTASFFTLSALFLCVLMLGAGWIIYSIPNQAHELYGPPSSDLDQFQAVYLSILLLTQENDLLNSGGLDDIPRRFEVALGESTENITNRLRSEGLITNPDAFRNYLVYSGFDTSIQAGEYVLNQRMTPLEIAHALQDSTPSELTFNILPGWRLEEIGAALATSGLSFSANTFLDAASNLPEEFSSRLGIPPGSSFEGYLFPDTYRFPRDITVQGFLEKVMDNFVIKVDDEIKAGFMEQNLSIHQAIILASIVQRETVLKEEAPLIASVFLNRFLVGTKLDSDPTVQYALGFNSQQGTWWTNPLSLNDLNIISPYNTYLYEGLPPGPIANPGIEAIRAVAFPEDTNYLYFRAACDGSGRHVFSETFEEHVANECP